MREEQEGHVKKRYEMIREWMVRCAACVAALALIILFIVSPTGEESTVFGTVNQGRVKFEMEAGESLTWEWRRMESLV